MSGLPCLSRAELHQWGRTYLQTGLKRSKVSEGRVAPCITLLPSGLTRTGPDHPCERRGSQTGMGAHWGFGFSLLKDLLAPDRSWSPSRQSPSSKIWSCSSTEAFLAWCGSTLCSHAPPLLSSDLAFLSLFAADFAFLCSGASEDSDRGAEVRERPRYEYGPGLEDPHYGLTSPDMGPYYNYLESEYGNPDAGFPRREPSSEFRGSPFHHGPGRPPPRYLPSQTGEYWETWRAAFWSSPCPQGLPGSSQPSRDAPGLPQALPPALLLAALSLSRPHLHHPTTCLMSPLAGRAVTLL